MEKEVKSFKSIEEQIQILKERGLVIDNEDQTKFLLKKYNYYRLSGYSLTLRKENKFYKGIKFSDIMQIYYFDKEIKLLLLNYLEEIEISLRTCIAYILGEKEPTSYLNKELYSDFEFYDKTNLEFLKCIDDNKHEAFIKHHKTKYSNNIPIWVLVETLSFGAISRFFSCLKYDLQKEICEKHFKSIPPKYIINWIEGLVILRNLCAHKSRLINRGLPNAFLFSTPDNEFFKTNGFESNKIGKKLFFALVLIDRIHPNGSILNDFTHTIDNLKERYPFVDINHYDFKNNYESLINEINSKYHPD